MVSPNFVKKFKRTPRNLQEIERLKQWYADKNCTIKLRGRHHDRIGLYERMGWRKTAQMDIPIEHAEEISFYAYKKYGWDSPPLPPKFQVDDKIDWKQYYGERR